MKTYRELRARHLLKFLYAHNAVEKFVRNAANQILNCPKKAYALGFLEGKNSLLTLMKECGNIGSSFTWARTPEGHSFWEKLNLEELKKNGYMLNDYNKIHRP